MRTKIIISSAVAIASLSFAGAASAQVASAGVDISGKATVVMEPGKGIGVAPTFLVAPRKTCGMSVGVHFNRPNPSECCQHFDRAIG